MGRLHLTLETRVSRAIPAIHNFFIYRRLCKTSPADEEKQEGRLGQIINTMYTHDPNQIIDLADSSSTMPTSTGVCHHSECARVWPRGKTALSYLHVEVSTDPGGFLVEIRVRTSDLPSTSNRCAPYWRPDQRERTHRIPRPGGDGGRLLLMNF